MNSDNKILSFLDDIYDRNKLNLTDIDLQYFSEKIVPFIHLVDYWASIIGLLLSKCDNFRHRRKIIKNLYDENCAEFTHVESFYSFLCNCKGEGEFFPSMQDVLRDTKSNQTIEIFKCHIYNFVKSHTFDECCQMLGAAEYSYLLAGKQIGELYLAHTGKSPLRHYTGNEIYGKQHTFNFFDCVENKENIDTDNLKFGIKWITHSMNKLLRPNL